MKKELINGAKRVGAYASKHSSILLTIGACIGVGGIIFTTAKSTLAVKKDLDNKKEAGEEVTKKEMAKIVVKDCWPVALTAGATIGCTVANHKVNTERILTATAARDFYKDVADTYKAKVRDKLGVDADREVEADIAADKFRDKYPRLVENPELIPGEGVIFIESLSGQVFRSSVDEIRQEERRFNEDLRGSDWICANEWIAAHLNLNPMHYDIGERMGFGERYDHDGLNIIFTPSDRVFATGETATIISYEDDLVSYNDYCSLNC